MIDPTKITNFNLDDDGLEEHLLFWIAVAGKNARMIAPRLQLLLDQAADYAPANCTPFEAIRGAGKHLQKMIQNNGIGCYTLKSKGMLYAAKAGLNLRTCTVEELDAIPGIGLKTAKCFIMHTRRDARHAGLDTHVLKFLREKGIDAPKQTPSSKAKYLELERKFLEFVDQSGKAVAEYDLMIWNRYSTRIKGWDNEVRSDGVAARSTTKVCRTDEKVQPRRRILSSGV